EGQWWSGSCAAHPAQVPDRRGERCRRWVSITHSVRGSFGRRATPELLRPGGLVRPPLWGDDGEARKWADDYRWWTEGGGDAGGWARRGADPGAGDAGWAWGIRARVVRAPCERDEADEERDWAFEGRRWNTPRPQTPAEEIAELRRFACMHAEE